MNDPQATPRFNAPRGTRFAGAGNPGRWPFALGRGGAGERTIGRRRVGAARLRRGSLVTEFSVAVVILGGACTTLAVGLQAAHRLEHSAALRDRAIERAANLLERARSIPLQELTPDRLTALAAAESRPGSLELSARVMLPVENASAGPRSYPIVVRATWGGSNAAPQQVLTLTGWVTESWEAAP